MTKEVTVGLIKEKKPWKSVNEYFKVSDTPSNREPSPDKSNPMVNSSRKA